ncbi:MAG: NAD-glutamate dehydrogenase [Gammaproteobacteria bacterium]|nr:MAG: NAD-glutamate dehydrogenase [Gammaproteobacteria bacterium]
MFRHRVEYRELIDAVLAQVRQHLPAAQGRVVEEFVAQYYAGTAYEDLAERDVANLYGAALGHWNFLRTRTPGTPKLRVYNPQLEQHGWQSTHTIVELVTDDMPFLVDSVRMALNRRGLTTHLVIHPVVQLRRDDGGRVLEILESGAREDGSLTEAVMHLEVDRQTDEEILQGMVADIEVVLHDVSAAVEDWLPMREKLSAIISELKADPPPVDAEELEHGLAFLEWMGDDHFTFLGYREYQLLELGGEEQLRAIAKSTLGVQRDRLGADVSQTFAVLPPEVRQLAREPRLLVITKANSRATVHRPGYLDHVGIKRFDAEGKVIGERRFLGLYTSAAYNRRPRAIPLLREKVARAIARAGYPRSSHGAKALINILETFPRDLLFQVSDDELFATAMGILHLQERQRIRLFVHRDPFGRFYSCIVYVPRDRFSTEMRLSIQELLARSLGGEDIEFDVRISESVLARLYLIVRVPPGSQVDFDVSEIEARLREITRDWRDDLRDALLDRCGEARGLSLYRRYGDAFSADYREHYVPEIAVYDIEQMETLADEHSLAMSLYRPLEAPDGLLQFKMFHAERPISLSDALPMLENMGLRVEEERPSEIQRVDGTCVWMHDFSMKFSGQRELGLDEIRDKFQETFARIWRGGVENDGFNRLVLRAKLGWREIVILRAYCKYLRQAGWTFSHRYIQHALAFNPHVAALLVQLFHARFDPDQQRNAERASDKLADEIRAALDEVAQLDEDRILRGLLGVILATLRTNYYQTGDDGQAKAYLSFKFDPKKVLELPEPRPMFEIFVYSPRVEGVHLRGGPVARGGLRWSDRREDFRTEVLGLVKAQMVKNAVIVPVGSKGGFVPKLPPSGGDREAIQAEGIACYKIFVSGLLDLTDNLVAGNVVPPSGVVRHDGDDPYLVVAADKGTATFSDIANGISRDYGFWLGDAFASGGSRGYDHKVMGITARGAWESVKRHFRELGVDTQTTDFRVIGIGDMSGDVFGNGMLLSRHIKLAGAFNHLHIFLDPDPDPETSFTERQRLFALPRSTWADYDRNLISRGGGVFPRTAKSIPISDQIRELLDVNNTSMPPNDLIKAMLRASVDLLWNGGIGTYVKSKDEHHDTVGDRANDGVRIDATELRCKIVGEGGNLGFTQRGRIEFAADGGRIYTDAIDNSAGVDTSDHEVNIKILLDEVVQNGDMTGKQRNSLLAEMTDEVGSLVLRNNYVQTQAMSLAVAQAPQMVEVHARLIRALERDGELDREVEFLPGKEEVDERISVGRGLTAPELSVLLAYVKIRLFKQLLESDLPGHCLSGEELTSYFPTPLRDRFRDLMPSHRLAADIISTELSNEIVNRAGITFIFRLREETGADPADISRAYMIARQVFDMPSVWAQIEALDNIAAAEVQIDLLLEGRKLVERASRWLLRNRPQPLDVAANTTFFSEGARAVARVIPDLIPEDGRAQLQTSFARLVAAKVPEQLARRVAVYKELYSALDIVEVARSEQMSVEDVSAVYFLLGQELELHWMRDQIIALPRGNRWQALARAALRDDLLAQARILTRDVLRQESQKSDAGSRIVAWRTNNDAAVQRCLQVLADLKGGPKPDFAMLSVAMREIRGMHAGEGAPVEVETSAVAVKPKARKARSKAKSKGKAA